MAAITHEDLTEVAGGASASPWDITAPATVNSGDLLLLMLASDGTADVVPHVDWTELEEVGEGTVVGSWYYIIADGTEDSKAYSFSSPANNEEHAWHIRRFSNWHGTTPPEKGTAVTGDNINPDPPIVSPSWGAEDENMYVAACANDADDTATSGPSGYTGFSSINSAGGGGPTAISSAYKSANSSSDDPGTFTLTSSDGFVTNTIVIRPSAGAAALTIDITTSSNYVQIV